MVDSLDTRTGANRIGPLSLCRNLVLGHSTLVHCTYANGIYYLFNLVRDNGQVQFVVNTIAAGRVVCRIAVCTVLAILEAVTTPLEGSRLFARDSDFLYRHILYRLLREFEYIVQRIATADRVDRVVVSTTLVEGLIVTLPCVGIQRADRVVNRLNFNRNNLVDRQRYYRIATIDRGQRILRFRYIHRQLDALAVPLVNRIVLADICCRVAGSKFIDGDDVVVERVGYIQTFAYAHRVNPLGLFRDLVLGQTTLVDRTGANGLLNLFLGSGNSSQVELEANRVTLSIRITKRIVIDSLTLYIRLIVPHEGRQLFCCNGIALYTILNSQHPQIQRVI